MTAIELYNAKLATGKYDHYTKQQKKVLLDDCIRQCEFMYLDKKE